jgi:hypothetical protein
MSHGQTRAGWRTLVGVKAQELDDLVQHLAVAKYSLEAGDPARASEAVDAAMAIARLMLTRNHAESDASVGADDSMVRTTSAGSD